MVTTTPDRSTRTLGILGIASAVTLALSLIFIFFVARLPSEPQGFCAAPCAAHRIFYFHVPAAWVAYLGFAIVFIASVAHLRTGARRWDLLAHAAAEVGVVFCSLVLITGPIWARPVWGTWWQWDARLTSTFVLWLTYVGYLFLRALTTDPARTGRLAAVVGIVGFLNVPIVHFSVQWWRTLHPAGPSPVFLDRSSGLGGQELLAFFTALIAFTLVFSWLLSLRTRLGRLSDSVLAQELAESAALRRSSPEVVTT
jgi:heme exporter protein C